MMNVAMVITHVTMAFVLTRTIPIGVRVRHYTPARLVTVRYLCVCVCVCVCLSARMRASV